MFTLPVLKFTFSCKIPLNTENPFSRFKAFKLIFISVSFTDITPSNFSSASVEYVLDEDTNVTYSVTISNDGGTAIAAASSGNNYAISFVASSSSDPTSASSVRNFALAIFFLENLLIFFSAVKPPRGNPGDGLPSIN